MLAFFGICGDYCRDILYFSATPKYKSCADAVRSLDNGNYFIQIDPDEGGLINVSCSKDGKAGKKRKVSLTNLFVLRFIKKN